MPEKDSFKNDDEVDIDDDKLKGMKSLHIA
jgi:hypothetical protein